MDELTLGVVATSGKADERRLPIHPRHLERIDHDLRRRLLVEHGDGRHPRILPFQDRETDYSHRPH